MYYLSITTLLLCVICFAHMFSSNSFSGIDYDQRDHIANQMKKERDQAARKHDQMKREQDQMVKEHDQMKKERDQAAKERDQMKGEQDQMAKEHDQIKNERDQAARERDQMKKERDQMAKEHDQMKKEQDQMVKEHDQMKKERDQAAKERDQMKREQAQMAKEHDQMKKEQDQMVKEHDQMKKERDQAAKERDQMKGEQDQMAKEHDQIKNERDQAARERDQMKGEQDQMAKEHGQIKNERDQAARERDQMKKEQDQMVKEHDQMKKERDQAAKECDQIKRELDQMKKELEVLKEEHSQCNANFWIVPRHHVTVMEKLLGEGSWGYVKEGKFRGQQVAVKCIHEAIAHQHTIKRVYREICTMSRVRHPNLVLFIAAVLDDQGGPMIITELLDTTLRKAYENNLLHPDLDQCMDIFRDVASALCYLHEHREPIIHRDVSSANVLLEAMANDRWKAKLSDFGSANWAKKAVTMGEGAIVYLAPEAYPVPPTLNIKSPPQTTKIDVYSYGILLCEITLRELPNPDVLNESKVKMSVKNAFLHSLMLECIQHEPTQRPTMANILKKLNL